MREGSARGGALTSVLMHMLGLWAQSAVPRCTVHTHGITLKLRERGSARWGGGDLVSTCGRLLQARPGALALPPPLAPSAAENLTAVKRGVTHGCACGVLAREVHPEGLPPSYTIVLLFRLLPDTPNEAFDIWQIADRNNNPEVGVTLNRKPSIPTPPNPDLPPLGCSPPRTQLYTHFIKNLSPFLWRRLPRLRRRASCQHGRCRCGPRKAVHPSVNFLLCEAGSIHFLIFFKYRLIFYFTTRGAVSNFGPLEKIDK